MTCVKGGHLQHVCMTNPWNSETTRALIRKALDEDLAGADDLTVAALVPETAQLRAEMTAKARGVLCGMALFRAVCDAVGGAVSIEVLKDDGSFVEPGTCVLRAQGQARCLLIAERTALNLMQRLSGTSTLTRQFVDAVAGTKAAILDTRKTTPGLRELQKHAVVVGGGVNHRIGLYDQVLIKENHIALMPQQDGQSNGPAEAVRRCRACHGPDCIIEVEIESLDDLDAVIEAGAQIVLLDNMGPDLLRRALEIRGDRSVQLEASGGIDLQTVGPIAKTGVDRISVGALTHSVPAFDLSLRCYPIVD